MTSKISVAIVKRIDGTMCTSNIEAADIFAGWFQSVFILFTAIIVVKKP